MRPVIKKKKKKGKKTNWKEEPESPEARVKTIAASELNDD